MVLFIEALDLNLRYPLNIVMPAKIKLEIIIAPGKTYILSYMNCSPLPKEMIFMTSFSIFSALYNSFLKASTKTFDKKEVKTVARVIKKRATKERK